MFENAKYSILVFQGSRYELSRTRSDDELFKTLLRKLKESSKPKITLKKKK